MPPARGDCDSVERGRGGGGSAGVLSRAARGRGGRCAQSGRPWVSGVGHLRAALRLLFRDREALVQSERSGRGFCRGSPGMHYLFGRSARPWVPRDEKGGLVLVLSKAGGWLWSLVTGARW